MRWLHFDSRIRPLALPAGTCKDCEYLDSAARGRTLLQTSAGSTSLNDWPTTCQRGLAYITSICEFHDSMRSCESTASTPTLIDSTMFSLKSFSRSYSITFFRAMRRGGHSGLRWRYSPRAFRGVQRLRSSGSHLPTFYPSPEPDHLLPRMARNVVIEVQTRDCFLRRGSFARGNCRVFSKKCAPAVSSCRAASKEAQIHSADRT